ncbi:MAG: hypothetical protein UX91_C0005G0004 [Candidatus Amesbacteria bacterium GW2011_GWB1_47_19]|nr:MAG: hypothetical protein UW51_C0007G0004 [Candidatus Amesbacteria bacterium GW2011_GWA1_44_24]KKU31086.1 MAG: hypothetical protein UX46_C0007G0004 [Candidatus Amesbacteria bacterium GW2011_GWC1_46_24]KKU67207.1 MAG: hypothetical protein UX91_C0005G0004 [Candidatus Amesbacteria bacterium GW2011_GWB1_47_19]OGD05768.1 MAG: hypothetical protein A2379_01420 [Candidatus Amesbacteria bacterium RIFOXYB1_FULL_47_13]HBC72623.1 hypothetical protein [Candidatus Amesbacteria bacterium]
MKRAFTLVEILIVIALMAVFSMFGIANFQGSGRKQSVIAGAERLSQSFKQARVYASAAKKEDCRTCPAAPAVCTGQGLVCLGADNLCYTRDDLELSGWSVTLDTTNNSFTVDGFCGSGINFSNRKAEELSNQVSMNLSESMPSGTRILFKPLGQGAVITPDLPAGSDNLVITISDTQSGFSRDVQVFTTGEVR